MDLNVEKQNLIECIEKCENEVEVLKTEIKVYKSKLKKIEKLEKEMNDIFSEGLGQMCFGAA